MLLFLVGYPEQRPHGERYGKSEDHIRNENTGEEIQANACPHYKAGVKSLLFPEGPDAECGSQQAKGNCKQRDR